MEVVRDRYDVDSYDPRRHLGAISMGGAGACNHQIARSVGERKSVDSVSARRDLRPTCLSRPGALDVPGTTPTLAAILIGAQCPFSINWAAAQVGLVAKKISVSERRLCGRVVGQVVELLEVEQRIPYVLVDLVDADTNRGASPSPRLLSQGSDFGGAVNRFP